MSSLLPLISPTICTLSDTGAGRRQWVNLCVFLVWPTVQSSLTNRLWHPNLLIISITSQSVGWVSSDLFPRCPHAGWRAVPTVGHWFGGFIRLATDWSAFQDSKHGACQREFLPCVNSYRMETIWVYRRPNHFCTKREMWNPRTPFVSKQMTKALGMSLLTKCPESWCRERF